MHHGSSIIIYKKKKRHLRGPRGSQGDPWDPRGDPRYMLCSESGTNVHLVRPFDAKT